MYVSARQLLREGLEGKWVRVTPEEAAAIVDSIEGENFVRGAAGLRPLHYHQHGEHIEVHALGAQAESSEPN